MERLMCLSVVEFSSLLPGSRNGVGRSCWCTPGGCLAAEIMSTMREIKSGHSFGWDYRRLSARLET